MSNRINDDRGEDENLGLLLRETGTRKAPSAAMADEVRRIVHAEWCAVTLHRQRRRWYVGSALAASIAAAAIALLISVQPPRSTLESMAAIVRTEGTPEVSVDGGRVWQHLQPEMPLAPGTQLRTDATAHVVLRIGAHVSLRLDSDSLIALDSPDRISLDLGAVYVDAQPQPQTGMQSDLSRLVIETRYGSVSHLGTQYEVRTMSDAVAVTVREGRVSIDSKDHHYEGAVGERLLIGAPGLDARSTLSPQDPDWEWAIRLAPDFDIERQPLTHFLGWVARETGKPIQYASPEIRARAEQLILRGSVKGLPPQQALLAVLATTPFTTSITGSTILIRLAP